ncbi:MAG: glycosyltransferase [Burkholderiales bacterium]|nr:glycosyltransferase [Burkholderiales bacterium]
MTTAAPTVSVVMPCYNAAAHLPAAVDSLRAQTFRDWELIAIDDGSEDQTLVWLRSQNEPRLRVETQANQGVSAARNAGLRLARGRYIAFLDADDAWAANFIEKMVEALESHPDAALAYCGWQNVGLPGQRGEPFTPPDYETPEKLETLFAGCRWPIHAAMARLDAVRVMGGFNPLLKNAEDYALWLELAGRGPLVRVPAVLAFYNFHGLGQASSNRAQAALQLLAAQQDFIRRHPEFEQRIGGSVRGIVYGQLLLAAYEAYWGRDLHTARVLFRRVMRSGYGSATDWRYMLPSLLPRPLHALLIRIFERRQAGPGQA